MNTTAAATPALRKRSGVIAAVLAYFFPPVAFAYLQRPGWGVVFLLMGPVVMLMAGQLGLPFTVPGYYALLAILLVIIVVAVVMAIRFARALPAGSPRRWYNRWYHYLWIAGVTFAATHFLSANRGRMFGYEPYRLPAASMEPTLKPGDFITVDFRSSSLANIHVGDVVIFEPAQYPGQRWIKRVVGVPGQTIEVRGNNVIVDGTAQVGGWNTIREPVLADPLPFSKVRLGADDFFLMGDNRPNSEDSRFTGPVKRDAIVGKARAIWLHYGPGTGRIDASRIGPIPSPGG